VDEENPVADPPTRAVEKSRGQSRQDIGREIPGRKQPKIALKAARDRKYFVLARLGGAKLRPRHAGAAQTLTRLSEAQLPPHLPQQCRSNFGRIFGIVGRFVVEACAIYEEEEHAI
jgi:hypothetical protein